MFGLYRKLLITYLLILAAIIAILSMLVFQFFKAELFERNQNMLLDAGQYINTLLVQYQRGDINEQDLIRSINTTGQIANARIIVIEGRDYLRNREYLKEQINLDDDELLQNLQEIYYGNTVVSHRQYSESLDSYVTGVGMPAKIGGEVIGAIILFTPVGKLDLTLEKVIDMIIITAMVAFAVGFILVFFVSKSISKPIIAVSNSAQELAAGKDTMDLQVSSNDEIGQLVNSFNEMKWQLQQTEKMRRELIAGVSHELRAPLAAIRGFVQGILDGVIDIKDQQKYLTITLQEINRLTRITNDLLELAKLESGNIRLNKKVVNIQRLTNDVIELLKDKIILKQLHLNINNNREMLMEIDDDRIRQVVRNILENAIRYTPEGGKIGVHVKEELFSINIIIEDTGIGIPESEQPYIFDTFYRVEKSRNQSHGGIGLGLAIAKNIVNLHNGEIQVESKLHNGTTMIVKLPKA
ncbi:sensor histidine kinase [Desulfuribacillus alkaliarsenatis]|uniref:histidine kinase n=1 Tax=Desulfuribacillus alkaliarsenatis TaxID=766136 RepID=A0A1E5G336_9FIRM|nr:HAMP domain-containing sensor histidine kinase [Desulfuribacillus alkaliarsenatis]OEF97487.1 hypothetical protein BHF68_04585 [Desulfuribacillus alkaliarsenatis]